MSMNCRAFSMLSSLQSAKVALLYYSCLSLSFFAVSSASSFSWCLIAYINPLWSSSTSFSAFSNSASIFFALSSRSFLLKLLIAWSSFSVSCSTLLLKAYVTLPTHSPSLAPAITGTWAFTFTSCLSSNDDDGGGLLLPTTLDSSSSLTGFWN